MMQPVRSNRRSYRARRRGYSLVLFTLLFFGLMALAALVIDLGLARVTQRQVQTAVDGAALEGLRGRDRTGSDYPDPQRRTDAAQIVAWTFDDDFELGSDAQNFGAGPRVNLTGGVPLGGGFNASTLISVSDPPVYDPDLKLNTENEADGDLVAGTFHDDPADYEPQPGYDRADFTPAPSGTPAGEADAFLVRLRRSNEAFLPADQARSNESPIPYLFGRGSLLAAEAKENGITVRATAIAQARPAMAIGKRPEFPPEVEALEIPGALPFVLRTDAWSTSPTPMPINIEIDPDDPSFLTVDNSRGRGLVLDSTTLHDGLGVGLSVGEAVLALEPASGSFVADMVAAAALRSDESTMTNRSYGFVGLYVEDSGRWIAGFGVGYVDPTSSGFTITPISDFVAWRNSQVTPSRLWEAPDAITASLLTAHQSIQSPLLAPALVR